ncbi:hypothetical protein D9619_005547 [Psilocybe cf. subviscida]|uniref:UEV domain-containing protein n=1 Tax=Psilocybe cf. subviscida TaxID=2480587 RepID=A0A8H5BWC5_9AGAR|nr:hypothetical protein D9619_005547 [Psilocybe cf. subviscida]
MALSLTQRWLKDNAQPYAAAPRVYADLDAALARFPSLRPKSDVYTFDDGRTQLLLCLHGLLPIVFRAASYNIPVALWIPRDYPRDVPLVYVVPTQHMLVKPGRHVDPSGRTTIDYISHWHRKDEGCNVAALLDALQDQFSREPPVYAKPKPQSAPPGPPALPSKPSTPAFAQQQQSHPSSSSHHHPAPPQPPLTSSPSPAPPPPPPPPPPSRPPLPPHPHLGPPHVIAYANPNIHPQTLSSSPIPNNPPRVLGPNPPFALSAAQPQPPTGNLYAQAPGHIPAQLQEQVHAPSPSHPNAYYPPPNVNNPPAATHPNGNPNAIANANVSLSPKPQAHTGNYSQPATHASQAQSPPPPPRPPHPPHAQVQHGYSPYAASPPPPPLPPLPAAAQQIPQQQQQQYASPIPFVGSAPQPQYQAPKAPIPNLLDQDDISAASSTPNAAYQFPAVSPPGGASIGAAAPPRPPNPELLALHTAVHAKLSSALQALSASMASDAERLRAVQADLLQGEPAIRDEMGRLEAVRDVCLGVGRRVGECVREAEGRLAEVKRRRGANGGGGSGGEDAEESVDEVVCATSIVHNQCVEFLSVFSFFFSFFFIALFASPARFLSFFLLSLPSTRSPHFAPRARADQSIQAGPNERVAMARVTRVSSVPLIA